MPVVPYTPKPAPTVAPGPPPAPDPVYLAMAAALLRKQKAPTDGK